MAFQHERTKARKCASQMLYSGAIRNMAPIELLNSQGFDCIDEPVSDYAIKLVEGVEEKKPELDERLASSSKNWSIDRMPLMDLAILRLALFEMLYVDEVPISVSINEAVELAKEFGGEDDSPKFVNGILGKIARDIEGAEEASENCSADDSSLMSNA